MEVGSKCLIDCLAMNKIWKGQAQDTSPRQPCGWAKMEAGSITTCRPATRRRHSRGVNYIVGENCLRTSTVAQAQPAD
jgi:hypothetical protein